MHFQQLRNSTKCRLTRPEHRKWASVPWPSGRPLPIIHSRSTCWHRVQPSRISHSKWPFKIGRRSKPSTPVLCGVAQCFLGLTCFAARITVFKMKVNKTRLWTGSSPTRSTCVEKGFVVVIYFFFLEHFKWEQAALHRRTGPIGHHHRLSRWPGFLQS